MDSTTAKELVPKEATTATVQATPSATTNNFNANNDNAASSPSLSPVNSPSSDQIPVQSQHKLFKLLEEPEDVQRKAYKNENRYVLPNPLVVVQEGEPHKPIKDSVVSVKLVQSNGEAIEEPKQSVLLDGIKKKAMTTQGNEANKRAEFALKILETSGKNKFRLMFTVTYTMDNILYEEQILTIPFQVISTKKKNALSKPKLKGILPRSAPSCEETEVWIRGSGFSDKADNVIVKFGDREAKIIEIEEHLIVCLTPQRPDLSFDSTVPVIVANVHSAKGQLLCEKPLFFRYSVGNSMPQHSLPMNGQQQHMHNHSNHTNRMLSLPLFQHERHMNTSKEDASLGSLPGLVGSASNDMHGIGRFSLPPPTPSHMHMQSQMELNSNLTAEIQKKRKLEDDQQLMRIVALQHFQKLHQNHSKALGLDFHEDDDPFVQRTF